MYQVTFTFPDNSKLKEEFTENQLHSITNGDKSLFAGKAADVGSKTFELSTDISNDEYIAPCLCAFVASFIRERKFECPAGAEGFEVIQALDFFGLTTDLDPTEMTFSDGDGGGVGKQLRYKVYLRMQTLIDDATTFIKDKMLASEGSMTFVFPTGGAGDSSAIVARCPKIQPDSTVHVLMNKSSYGFSKDATAIFRLLNNERGASAAGRASLVSNVEDLGGVTAEWMQKTIVVHEDEVGSEFGAGTYTKSRREKRWILNVTVDPEEDDNVKHGVKRKRE